MRKLLIFMLLLLSSALVFAQKKPLTLEQTVLPYKYGLYPKTLFELQWRGTTGQFTYVSGDSLIAQDAVTGKKSVLLTLPQLNMALGGRAELMYLGEMKWIDNNRFYLVQSHYVVVYNVKSGEVERLFVLPKNAKNIFYSPQAKAVAYTVRNNLFYTDSLGVQYQITTDKDTNIINGGNYVHRQEFGIDHGIFWSPKGNYIAFYHEDLRPVSNYPVIDFTKFPAKVHYLKYPFAGHASEHVTLGVYNLKEHEITYMQTGQPLDHYLTSVTWDPSEKYIYIGILNRDQNHLWMNKYDVYSGKLVKTLFQETNPKYVEPLHPLYFVPDHDNEFIYFSRKDGWWHLYLYDTQGNFIRKLTSGPWVVTDLIGFSKHGKYVYIQTTKVSPLQRQVYKVDLSNAKMTRLTFDHGYHTILVSPDDKYYLDDYTSMDVPHRIVLYSAQAKKIRTILDSPNPLAGYELGKVKIGTITAADGKTKLYYRMILPPNFDPHKKYPVIVYVYGGPHVQLIQDVWLAGAQMWLYYFAQNGYIIFTVDNRGSNNRGFAFESVIYRHLGVNEMKDQIKGIEFLKSLPYVDTSRIGVHGWSFGGFMTCSLMTTYPNVFKVGVAGGPVIDWHMYEVMYGERYMDTPQSNPKGYAETSVLNKIQNLKGHLLIIHGQIDPVVVPENSMKLLMKAQKLGVQVDYYPYPHQKHGVAGAANRVYLYRKILNYFNLYLKPQQ